ncbi:hypothetical protein ACFL7M_16855 [Thermodesulfobacteriota bacterium]
MEVSNNLQSTAFSGFTPKFTKSRGLIQSNDLPLNKVHPSKDINASSDLAQATKEMSTEMLPKERRMGEFKNQDWIEEAKNFQIGPDIRYAVKSKNPDFLKRIQWGPLTSAEYREVTHQIKNIERQGARNSNILKGQIIADVDIRRGRSDNNRSVIDIKV